MIVKIKTFSGENLYIPEEDYLNEVMYSRQVYQGLTKENRKCLKFLRDINATRANVVKTNLEIQGKPREKIQKEVSKIIEDTKQEGKKLLENQKKKFIGRDKQKRLRESQKAQSNLKWRANMRRIEKGRQKFRSSLDDIGRRLEEAGF